MNNIHWVEETPSTNSLLAEMLQREEVNIPSLFAVGSSMQTSGRGQRGNSWVVEYGQNLTCSILLRLESFSAECQFFISEYFALAVYNILLSLLPQGKDSYLSLKWPNDIYYVDCKLGGILIENNLQSRMITSSILGLGLNLNQKVFPDSLPNPISLSQITGLVYEPRLILKELQFHLELLLPLLQNTDELHRRYLEVLYRRTGVYSFRDNQDRVFNARIETVLPTGQLVLRTEQGEKQVYYFKEISFI